MIAMTGSTGFIGSALFKALENEQVWPLSERLENMDRQYLDYVTSRSKTFLHLAWPGIDSGLNGMALEKTKLIIDLCKKNNCEFIGFGSRSEYVQIPHGVAKNKAARYAIEKGFSWIRLWTVYGPGDHSHKFIPTVIRELRSGERPKLSTCEQEWDFLYIDDCIGMVLYFLKKTKEGRSGDINICYGKKTSFKYIADTLHRLISGSRSPLYGALENTSFDDPHGKPTYDFPMLPIHEGLKRCV